MKKLKNKFLNVFILVVFLLNIVFYTIPVYGATMEPSKNDKIHIDIYTDKTVFNDGEFFEFSLNYKILDKLGSVNEGDTISFTLPKEFSNCNINYPKEHFKDMQKQGDLITLVFGDAAKTALAGYIKLKGHVQADTKITKQTFIVELNGEKIAISNNITVKPVTPNPTPTPNPNNNSSIVDRLLCKNVDNPIGYDSSGNILSEITGKVIGKTKKYSIYINEKYSTIHNARLLDKMPQGMELLKNSIKISKIDLNNTSIDETNSFFKNINNNTIDINFGNINCKYILEYETKVIAEMDSYKNTAILIKPDGTLTSSAIVKRNFSENNIVSKYTYNSKTIQNPDGSNIKVASLNDKVSYGVYVNQDKLYIENVLFEDFIPKGMKYVQDSLIIGQYDDKGNFKWVTNDFIHKLKITDDKITIEFGNTEYKYIINYTLEITNIEKSYQNKAKVSYNNTSKETIETVNYEMNTGAINAQKTVDKSTLKQGDNNTVKYTIAFDCYGVFEKNYLKLEDTLDKRIKILKVEVPEQFSYYIDYNSNTVKVINSKNNINYNSKLNVNIYTDFSGVPAGSTVNNIAKINDTISNKVETKKGYAFITKKVDSVNKTKTLEGAKFLLKDSNNKIIKEVISDKNGIITSDLPSSGDYYLKEIKAPKGYELLNNDIYFEVKDTDVGTTLNLGNIKNNQKKLVIHNATASELIDLSFDEVSIFNSKSPQKEAANVSKEKEKESAVSKKPLTFVTETEIDPPLFEEVADFNSSLPQKETATASKEKEKESAVSKKPLTFVTETEMDTPLFEEVADFNSSLPQKETATASKEKGKESAVSKKPLTFVTETEMDPPLFEEVADFNSSLPQKETAVISTEKEKEIAHSQKPIILVAESTIDTSDWDKVTDFATTIPKQEIATISSEPENSKHIISKNNITKDNINKQATLPKTGDSCPLSIYFWIVITNILGVILIRKK